MSITMSDTDKLEIRIMKLIEEKLDKFEVSINKRFDDLERKMVKRPEFELVRAIVFGAVGMVLIAYFSQNINLIIK